MFENKLNYSVTHLPHPRTHLPRHTHPIPCGMSASLSNGRHHDIDSAKDEMRLSCREGDDMAKIVIIFWEIPRAQKAIQMRRKANRGAWVKSVGRHVGTARHMDHSEQEQCIEM